MKSLAICLLVLGIALVGCGPPKTGWHCPDCGTPAAKTARTCPNCNGNPHYGGGWLKDGSPEVRSNDKPDSMPNPLELR